MKDRLLDEQMEEWFTIMGISLTPITGHKQSHLYTLRQNDFEKMKIKREVVKNQYTE